MTAILCDVILNIVLEQSIIFLLSGYTPIILYTVGHLEWFLKSDLERSTKKIITIGTRILLFTQDIVGC